MPEEKYKGSKAFASHLGAFGIFTGHGTVTTIDSLKISEIRRIRIGKLVEIEANYIPTDPGQIAVLEAIRGERDVKIRIEHGAGGEQFFPVRLAGFVDFPPNDVVSLLFNFENSLDLKRDFTPKPKAE